MAQWHRPGSTQQGSYFPLLAEISVSHSLFRMKQEITKGGYLPKFFLSHNVHKRQWGGGKGGFHEKVGKIGIFEI